MRRENRWPLPPVRFVAILPLQLRLTRRRSANHPQSNGRNLAALYSRRVINSPSPPGPPPPRGDSAQAITDGGAAFYTQILTLFSFFFSNLPPSLPSRTHPPTHSLFTLADSEILLYAPLYLAAPRSATATSLRLREETQPDASFVLCRAPRRTRRDAAASFFFPKPVLKRRREV